MATFNGTSFADNLVGTNSADTMNGRAGDDVIRGGGGRDTISTGSGRDIVVYQAVGDSLFGANWDLITDFERGSDRIDLTALSAVTGLIWGGTTPTANGVWYSMSGTTLSVFIDTNNAPATPEMRIDLQNMAAGTVLAASDFLGVAAPAGAAPVFALPAPTFSVAENTTTVGMVTATDADSPTLTYSIAGADAGFFTIIANTGALSFTAAPDFETRADAGADNVYNITVQASDGTLSANQAVTVTVTNVNDVAPVFAAPPAAFSVPENTTVVGPVTATDADGPTLTYSIAGADAGFFTIIANTGALSFTAAPDFETRADAGADNIYNVTVQASDGTLSANKAVTVTVTDVNESGINGTAGNDVIAGTIGNDVINGGAGNDAITGNDGADTMTGGLGSDTFVYPLLTEWQVGMNWQVVPTATTPRTWDVITDFQPGTDKIDVRAFLPGADLAWGGQVANANTVWFAVSGSSTFVYLDAGGDGMPPPELMIELQNTASVTATDFIGVVGGSPARNVAAPVFPATPATFSVAENTTVVGPVTATDADGPTLSYSISGTDSGLFGINMTSGALTFNGAPDFERPLDAGADNVYNLTVQATDGTFTANQAVTVTVTNVVVEAITGTVGNDTLTGTAGDDTFDIRAGGNDTVAASSGNDTILAGASFTAADRIDGGTEVNDTNETDTLVLDGDYAAGVTLTATTLVNVEEIQLAAGNSYSLTTSDATVVASSMSIDGSALGAANTLTVNAAAETEAGANYTMTGGAGNDTFTGGAGADYFDISFGGTDTVNGGAGRDTIFAGSALTAADQVNGGTGIDTVYLNGNYSAGLTFGATTLTAVEVIVTQAGNNYALTMNNGMLTGTQTAMVDGFALGSGNTLTVNASAETDTGTVYTLSGGAGNDNLTGGAGNDVLNGYAGNDILVGGAGNDILTGGAGSDTLTGGLGNDVYDFNVLADTGTTGDTITAFSKFGTNGVDVLNVHDLLLTFTGFNGTNAFSGGYLQFDSSSGTATTVQVDANGGANSFVTLATLSGTLLLQTDTTNYVL